MLLLFFLQTGDCSRFNSADEDNFTQVSAEEREEGRGVKGGGEGMTEERGRGGYDRGEERGEGSEGRRRGVKEKRGEEGRTEEKGGKRHLLVYLSVPVHADSSLLSCVFHANTGVILACSQKLTHMGTQSRVACLFS